MSGSLPICLGGGWWALGRWCCLAVLQPGRQSAAGRPPGHNVIIIPPRTPPPPSLVIVPSTSPSTPTLLTLLKIERSTMSTTLLSDDEDELNDLETQPLPPMPALSPCPSAAAIVSAMLADYYSNDNDDEDPFITQPPPVFRPNFLDSIEQAVNNESAIPPFLPLDRVH